MSRKYIAREVLKRLRLGEPLGEELVMKFIRFLPELYKNSNGYDDFAKLRHDVFSAFRYDHADELIGFDLGACWGAISEEENVSLDYAQAITSLRVNNSKLRELLRDVYVLHWYGVDCTECPWFDECDNHGGGCPWLGIMHDHMRELGIEVP